MTQEHTPKLYTIGIQGLTPTEFHAWLKLYHLERLIDVRPHRFSRQKGFMVEELEAMFADLPFHYTHHPNREEAITVAREHYPTANTALVGFNQNPELCPRREIAIEAVGADLVVHLPACNLFERKVLERKHRSRGALK